MDNSLRIGMGLPIRVKHASHVVTRIMNNTNHTAVIETQRVGQRGTILPGLIILLVIATVSLVALANSSRTTLSYYDEGVNYYQAVLMARGQRPYTDFFVAHPPGVLLVGALNYTLGFGLTGVRVVSWLCGMIALYQSFWLGRHLARSCNAQHPVLVGVTAAALVILSNRFVYVLTQGATDMPALCLSLAAGQMLLRTNCRHAWSAEVVFGLATLFRLQPVSFLPGFLALIAAVHGLRGGIRPAVSFTLGLGVTAAAIHGSLALVFPKYVDAAFLFQAQRTRLPIGEKVLVLTRFLGEPHVAFAFFAAVCVAVGRVTAGRAIAWYALCLVLITTLSGNSLYLVYYVPALPYMAAAAAFSADVISQSVAGGRLAHVCVVLVAAGGTGLLIKEELLTQRRMDPVHRRFVDAIRDARGDVIWAEDGRIAILAGKRMPDDYYATDPNALYQLQPERFATWLRETVPNTQVIAVTPLLINWLNTEDAIYLRNSGKQLMFESEATEQRFLSLVAR